MLRKGIEQLGLEVSQEQLLYFKTHLELLLKWNKTYNLSAIRQMDQMITHHTLDSLAVAPYLKEKETILDVGSGAGFPGLVLAIYYPNKKITLVDTVQKKTSFLTAVKNELQLNNVTVFHERVEKMDQKVLYDAIISRAFASIKDFMALSQHLLAEKGTFYAMKAAQFEEELEDIKSSTKSYTVVPLKIPFLDASRTLITIQ